MSAELKALFDYDLWANRLWAEHLASRGWPETERDIFRHMLAASTIWSLRIHGESPDQMPSPKVADATMVDLHRQWLAIVTNRDLGEVITYRRTTGEELEGRIGEIAQHVVNHGTYHRGELRGLCRAGGVDSFPETDYFRFVLVR